jgi:hypothetical protein
MITYGNGKVLYDGSAKAFEIKYKGVIRITSSPDKLFIKADRKTIKGIMIDGSDMPQEIFTYVGELRLLSAKTGSSNLERDRIRLQGVDYWELDNEKWGDDNSLWGTRNRTYLVGSKQRYNAHNIVVNNNIKTQYLGQFHYPDGSPVPANEPIHIHSDGVVMSGGVHGKDSVTLKVTSDIRTQKNTEITQTITQQPATATPTSGSGSSGGGGY